jgi:hypothetical protein
MITFNEWLYKNKVNEYMTDFSSLERSPKPKTGDKAYTRLSGHEVEGVLVIDSEFGQADKAKGTLHVNVAINKHGDKEVRVGYDEPIQWDSKRNMWYAPADYN